MAGVSVGDRLNNVKSRVAEACVRAGRDSARVHVLAVSKQQPLGKIREAFENGQRDFAENYVQEALDKLDQLHSLPVDWHFIGRIQSNKVKHLVNRFKIIHSVDRISIAEALNRLSVQRPQDVFLQYNVAGEASKGGASELDLLGLVKFVLERCPNLRVLGLMVMPPLGESARVYFRLARETQERLRAVMTDAQKASHPFDQLSMGTSADFEDAIAEGATWIRIGTDIFGPREESE